MYDFAISFSGQERPIAEGICTRIRHDGFSVFYDEFENIQLWGEDLTIALPARYKNSKYVMALISRTYLNGMWTIFERQIIIETFLELGGSGYFLPVYIGDVQRTLPGLSGLVGYKTITGSEDVEALADAVIQKLRLSGT